MRHEDIAARRRLSPQLFATAPAGAADAVEFLFRQDRAGDGRLRSRRGYDSMPARWRLHGAAYSRPPDNGAAEYAGRFVEGDELHLQRRAQGRHRDGHVCARPCHRAVAWPYPRHPVRRDQIQLDRQRVERGLGLRLLAHQRGQVLGGHEDQAAQDRRLGGGRRQRRVPDGLAQGLQPADEARDRLCRRRRRHQLGRSDAKSTAAVAGRSSHWAKPAAA